MKALWASFVFAFATTAVWGQTPPPVPQAFQDASKTIGKPGTFNADGSYRINIARTDVTFTNASGMAIPADMGLATYIAFSPVGEEVLAVGDVAMLEGEIDGVVDALRKSNYEVVSLHNHMTTEEPRLFYLHFEKTGTVAELAAGFKPVLAVLGHGAKTIKAPKVGKPKIDQDALSDIFGSKPQVFPSGVVRYANPRKDITVKVDDIAFSPGMGLGSWAAFNACECGLTMVMGDTCCTRSDLQHTIDEYRKVGIHITAIHHHVLGGSVETALMHYEGEGDVLKLAAGIKSAWNGLGK